ncbi:MAG: glutaconyl-CoA/methylmalonyl-CoA decarboxylase subunit gamma [Candidatus Cloacimonadota bacterium]|jgi:biotin carboxyl carrier protein|nr:glutaconyl-CoA/methylmalonyl-CoA decarboxylase subunit gamma [Candidatus Cloacimonadota bacterium]
MKTYKFKINHEIYKTKILEYKGSSAVVEVNGNEYFIEIEREAAQSTPRLVRSPKSKPEYQVSSSPARTAGNTNEAEGVTAPIAGLIHAIKVKEGDVVNEGDVLLILEAMKMESEITADSSGTVKKVLVKEGENVQEGQLLIEIGE